MNFIEETKKSIFGPEFYQELKEGSVKHAIGYFFRLGCLLSLLSTFIFAIVFIPKFINLTSRESLDALTELFPKELTLTIQAGHLSTNVPEPYVIKMPTGLGSAFAGSTSTEQTENLVVIATAGDPSISTISKTLSAYKSRLLITGTDIISKDNNGKVTIQSLAEFPNTTINQDKFKELIEKLRPFLKFIVPIGIPFIFLAFLTYFFAVNLLFGFLLALLILILGKLLKWEISYWGSYVVSLHAMTLGIVSIFLVNTVGAFAPLELNYPRFLFSLIALIVVYVNLRHITPSSNQTVQ